MVYSIAKTFKIDINELFKGIEKNKNLSLLGKASKMTVIARRHEAIQLII